MATRPVVGPSGQAPTPGLPGLRDPGPQTPAPAASPGQVAGLLAVPTPSAPASAFALLDAARKGQRPARAALVEIANAVGLPLSVGNKLVFVRLADGGGPYAIAGDFNRWQAVPMRREGELYLYEAIVPGPTKYKLVGKNGQLSSDPLSRAYGYDENGEYSIARPAGAHLERLFDIGGASVAPRTIRLWVPQRKPDRHLYAHDGQNLFNPKAPSGGWRLHEQVGPSTLVVGIDHGDRYRELTQCADRVQGQWAGGGVDVYADFVHDELRPLIENRFAKPVVTGLLGSSLGGLAACNQTLRHPDAWDFVAAMSGTFAWGRLGLQAGDKQQGQTLAERFVGKRPGREIYYFDSGGAPGGGDNYDAVRAMADQLASQGFRWEENLYHWYDKGALHNEAAWAKRLPKPLLIFEAL